MRLVWVIISLILFSIIGIQESFAEQASGKSAWVTNSEKVCGDRLCSEIPYSQKETQGIESPKKQMQKGIHALDVMCKENLELVIRVNGLAACVRTETAERMQKAGMLFVPVEFTRSEKEIEVSMILGAVSKEEFEKNIEIYRSKKLIAYCTIGFRSSRYVEKLLKKGHNAFNLWGSILGWAHAGGELVKGNQKTRTVHTYGKTWDLLPEGYKGVQK